jgi:phage repressor protein C with HTH and peptisase S24 domain
MSDLKRVVQDRLTELDRGAVELAVAHGLSRDFIHDIISGKKTSVRSESAGKLARALQLPTSAILDAVARPADGDDIRAPARRPARIITAETIDLPQDLPIVGTAAGAAIGAITIDGPIGYERRPPALIGVPNAYACYVRGESMLPRFAPGDLVYVNPHRPPQAGDDILIQVEERAGEITAYVKQYVRTTKDSLCARQFNPLAEIEYKIRTVKYVHRILSGRELIT